MKKLLLALCLLCLTFTAQAEEISITEILEKMPMKQGFAYSIPDEEFRPLTTFSLLGNIKESGVSLDVGYVGDDKAIVALFYELGKLEKVAEVPILEFIELEIGAYYGLEGINKGSAGEDYGLGLLTLRFKF